MHHRSVIWPWAENIHTALSCLDNQFDLKLLTVSIFAARINQFDWPHIALPHTDMNLPMPGLIPGDDLLRKEATVISTAYQLTKACGRTILFMWRLQSSAAGRVKDEAAKNTLRSKLKHP
jgi:hypothetical protein